MGEGYAAIQRGGEGSRMTHSAGSVTTQITVHAGTIQVHLIFKTVHGRFAIQLDLFV
jgi:hypothetical protein